MENILFNILGIAFLGAIAVAGMQAVADGLETHANQVSHCIDQLNSKVNDC